MEITLMLILEVRCLNVEDR